MATERANALLPHYVYALADPRDNTVFYVGKGAGTRVLHHWQEVLRDMRAGRAANHPKRARLEALAVAGLEPLQRVIARFETADEAFAVESVLINWTYGFDAITNLNRGRNHLSVRPKDCWTVLEGIDVPRRDRRIPTGAFRNARVMGLTAAGAYDYLSELAARLEGEDFLVRDFEQPDDGPYDPGEANGYLGILVRIEGVDLLVDITKKMEPRIKVATTASTREHQQLLVATGWTLSSPKNTSVRGVGRYRDFVVDGRAGPLVMKSLDDLVAELTRMRDELRRLAGGGS